MSLLDRIVIDPEIAHGRPTVRGTRMRVTDVLALLAAGADTAEIVEDYPYIAAEGIQACLEYAAVQADFSNMLARDGTGPSIVWVRTGNTRRA